MQRTGGMNDSFLIHEIKKPDLPNLESTPPFWQVAEAPEKIYVQGRAESLILLERLPRDGFAIVGTRNPQTRSKAEVRKIVNELQGTSLIILSGFARGIDAEAHRAALQAGLPTIAVLGTGMNSNYPSENSELRQEILEAGGLCISEFPVCTQIFPSNFIQRNRLIAGWAEATWIVEAGYPSGALNTAKWARNQHRTCYATPSFPNDPAFSGNQGLLDRDEAIPLWSTESLGQSWSFLATPYSIRKKLFLSSRPFSSPDAKILSHQVQVWSSRYGGASIQQLLDWALSSGWTPEQFFSSLEYAIQSQEIYEENGILAAGR